MNKRIALVLRAKNITPSQFAEELGVQRSGISHILNGRNKPSLEFIQKLIKQYPDISMNWLMFGEGPMMNPYPDKETVAQKIVSPSKPVMMELFETSKEEIENTAKRFTEEVSDNSDTVNLIDQKVDNIDLDEMKDNDQPPLFSNPIEIKDVFIKQKAVEVDNNDSTSRSFNKADNRNQSRSNGKKIKRIVIFYEDRSFVEYMPGEE